MKVGVVCSLLSWCAAGRECAGSCMMRGVDWADEELLYVHLQLSLYDFVFGMN